MADQHRLVGQRVSMLMALVVVACTCAVLGTLSSRAQAAPGSGPYCQSVWLHNHGEICTYGVPVNYTYQLVGSGAQHSVRVWMLAGATQCSGGGLQAVYNSSMAPCGKGCGYPQIKNNGYDWNQVWGYYYHE
jgi:hypothetical protein